ncbi:MAG: hypothetical protein OXB98_20605 [Bryobacterales bacterium]|nr:hypothetical protein [Bryobacterales bacterium]
MKRNALSEKGLGEQSQWAATPSAAVGQLARTVFSAGMVALLPDNRQGFNYKLADQSAPEKIERTSAPTAKIERFI